MRTALRFKLATVLVLATIYMYTNMGLIQSYLNEHQSAMGLEEGAALALRTAAATPTKPSELSGKSVPPGSTIVSTALIEDGPSVSLVKSESSKLEDPSSLPSSRIQELPSNIAISKVIVMGRLDSEDTSWVQEELSDWQNAIYTVNNRNATLHMDENTGKEANVYLRYIVDHYDALPDIIVFVHAHKDGYPVAWHNDQEQYSNVMAIRNLRLDFVQRNGYANLRCNWDPGCPNEMQPFRDPYEKQRVSEHHLPHAWRYMFEELEIPNVIAAACCAQFAVSKEQVLARPREDYSKYRQWIVDSREIIADSGRVLEYLWHIIFGQEAVYCPQPAQCYCEVYGRC